jgi:histidinol dehydrogenase
MKILTKKREIDDFLGTLRKRGEGVSADVVNNTGNILASVRRGGDRAVRRYTRKFDGHGVLRLAPSKIKKAAGEADAEVVKALRLAARRIRRFHRKQKERSWSFAEKGARLGQIIRPLRRVGVYVPGGAAAYPSTVLMNVIPAQVAGVDEIAVTVPTPGGRLNPHVMAALRLLGVEEVYSIGGAQAVAALAYGTESIAPVDKIVGPGNIYVATAKRMVFGTVDIDMIAGPSEILVIADSSARPDFVASDLLSQAEHDPLASSVLVTTSRVLARAVEEELKAQIKKLKRNATARSALRRYGAAIIVRSLEEAAEVSNAIAPEHLEIMTRNPRRLLPRLRNAGAIFLGSWTPEPIGDYAAGPNHTLPTGGTARWASPLGVYDFVKRSSLLEFTRQGFLGLASPVERIAEAEGLGAHVASVRIRRKA